MFNYARTAALSLVLFSQISMAVEDGTASDDGVMGAPEEPEVTIIQRGQERIEEYRVNNQIYMIKVIPSKGYPYYLVDSDGDGSFETRRNSLDSRVVIPQWVLFKWK